ncbi:MAG: hypothetical protein LLG00_05510 [Planctomycetaceae bacterium]|nr:hypothetical protein [Planctomycetaceae bacterium]
MTHIANNRKRRPPRSLPNAERRPSRCGAILIIIMVCFTLAAAMFVVLARLALTAREAADTQQWSLQAQWLAEAGLERAAVRLAGQPTYTGETWTITASELAAKNAGVVRIRIEKVAGRAAQHRVTVEADYPDDPVHRSRCTKQTVLEDRYEKQS